jgi:hypothetical protein
MALSIGAFEIFLRNDRWFNGTLALALVMAVFSFLTILMPLGIALYATIAAFRRRAAIEGLLVICVGYLSVLSSFAGVYYSFNVISDYSEAYEKVNYYRHASTRLDEGLYKSLPARAGDEMAFRGMRYSLWSGLDDEARPYFMHKEAKVPDDLLLEAARRYGPPWPGDENRIAFSPKFNADMRLQSLLQCFHFSVVTMATVGYGDVFPSQWYSQLVVDMQILIGQILVVVALGCVFGRWWEKP